MTSHRVSCWWATPKSPKPISHPYWNHTTLLALLWMRANHQLPSSEVLWKAVLLTQISAQFSSVTQSCPILCDPRDCSTPGIPVHHQLPETAQTHVHWVGDAIHPSHSLPSPSPPALNLSRHWGLFQWVSSLHQVLLWPYLCYDHGKNHKSAEAKFHHFLRKISSIIKSYPCVTFKK